LAGQSVCNYLLQSNEGQKLFNKSVELRELLEAWSRSIIGLKSNQISDIDPSRVKTEMETCISELGRYIWVSNKVMEYLSDESQQYIQARVQTLKTERKSLKIEHQYLCSVMQLRIPDCSGEMLFTPSDSDNEATEINDYDVPPTEAQDRQLYCIADQDALYYS
jgi:hypothetical protein